MVIILYDRSNDTLLGLLRYEAFQKVTFRKVSTEVKLSSLPLRKIQLHFTVLEHFSKFVYGTVTLPKNLKISDGNK